MNEMITNLIDSWRNHWSSINSLEKAIAVLLVMFALFLPLSIAGAQFSVGLALILWLVMRMTSHPPAPKIGISVPLFLFAAVSLVGIAFSLDPLSSLYNSRNLLMLLIVPLIVRYVRSSAQLILMLVALVLGALLTSGVGYWQVATGTAGGHTQSRLVGTLGHYMTAGGELMVASLLLVAIIFFVKEKILRIISASALTIIFFAMLLTQSRNAYIGLVAGLAVAIFLWKRWLVLLLPVMLFIVLLIAPTSIQTRALNIFNLEDESVKQRLYMLETGTRIVADFPLFGVGLDQVKNVYNNYKKPYDRGNVPHLHNNFTQIAVERGLPALAFWIWLFAALFRRLWRKAKTPNATPIGKVVSNAALSIITAILFAGLFEYNFGDSEIQMLFWFVVAIPFCLLDKKRQETT